MVKMSPQEYADKWAKRLKGSGAEIKQGIERVTEAPGVKAAAKVDKMRANLLESIDDGTWEKRVAAVSLPDWKKAAITKGLKNIASGADGASDKMKNFAAVLLPHVDQGQSLVEDMPDLTIEDSIARATAYMRHMADLNYKKR